MSFITRLHNWLRCKLFANAQCIANDINQIQTRDARDIGVTITRIRLPSGYEIVLVERIDRDK